MTNVIRFPVGEDRPYNVKTELFKVMDASSLPKILIDIFKQSTLKNRNPISTTQWNLNSFMVNDSDPDAGGIAIITDFRDVETPLFALRNNTDYLHLRYFSKKDDNTDIKPAETSIAMLFSSYMKYVPDIGAENWKFVVNLLEALENNDTIVIDGFTIESDCFAVRFSDPNNDEQAYGLVIKPLALLLDQLANFPEFKKEQPHD